MKKTTHSPSLEVISDDLTESNLERRRIPRLDLTTDQFKLAQNNKIYQVCNLSPMGMAIRVLENCELIHFTVGREISGVINVHGGKVEINARVKNVRGCNIGCEFHSLKDEVKSDLNNYLDPQRLANDLHLVPAGDTATLWYHGPSGTDILFWNKGNGEPHAFYRFSVFVFGTFVQWEAEGGITTGRTLASDEMAPASVARTNSMAKLRSISIDSPGLRLFKLLSAHMA